MKCVLKRTGETLAQTVEVADTYWTRLAGLMFRRELAAGSGLLLDPCPQVHTCFMRFVMDAVFFDKEGRVLHVVEGMKPWRFSRFVRGARYTLELPGGTLRGRVRVGDELEIY